MQYVENTFQPFAEENEPWKIQTMFEILEDFWLIDIGSKDIYDRYAEIDAFSQGKLQGRPLPLSARNMGKNDLWIAATTSILGATLLTTDADFEHLDGMFLKVERVVV